MEIKISCNAIAFTIKIKSEGWTAEQKSTKWGSYKLLETGCPYKLQNWIYKHPPTVTIPLYSPKKEETKNIKNGKLSERYTFSRTKEIWH